ncbi:MAG: replication-associated recombination protein A [Thiotrichaceae bacterium]|nr:replication-associated recombination protein A [Thiotrichaceae bacterium]
MNNDYRPLADRMRPRCLADYAGQQHLLAKNKPLRKAIETDRLHSMLFWGPPGTGKTTLAKLISHQSGAEFINLSAVLSGVKDIRIAMTQAEQNREMFAKSTVLFVDEVHRFNKAQQDVFLPYIENGTIFFIGATTENPSFELNNALLSRVRTYVLKTLPDSAIKEVIERAINNAEYGLAEFAIQLTETGMNALTKSADGDARRALNWLEIATDLAEVDDNGVMNIDNEVIAEVVQASLRRFDKGGDLFYEQISALHKSVRGSDPDASLYWLCRMLEGGCDPLYIARRVVRIASEDIGNADPRALTLALNAWQTYERLGSPEGELAIAQAVIYLASAAKSNAVDMAYKAAMQDVKSSASDEVPIHLRNASSGLMESLDYGKQYRYAHDEKHAYAAGENYFPDGVEKQYYFPVERGLEIKIKQKLDWLKGLNNK